MFTWICPQCGKEVPPHETECPYCAEAAKATAASSEAPSVTTPAAPASQPMAQAPPPPPGPAAPPAAQQASSQPVYYAVGAQRKGTPGWLVAILVAAALCAIAGGLYYYTHRPKAATSLQAQGTPFEKVPVAGGASGSSKLAKFIEVTGFRVSEDAKSRLQVQFLVVNHSSADIGDLAGTIRLRTTDTKPGEKDLATFDFKATKLGPYESIEFKVITSTGLRAYELPDWQFLTADVDITSPAGM